MTRRKSSSNGEEASSSVRGNFAGQVSKEEEGDETYPSLVYEDHFCTMVIKLHPSNGALDLWIQASVPSRLLSLFSPSLLRCFSAIEP